MASVLVVAVGGGYSASKALLTDGVAYAVDGKGVDRLNQVTGNPDAEILDLAKGTGINTVHKDGQVYLVDTATGSISRIDPGTLEVGPNTPPKPGPGSKDISVIAGGGATVLIDRDANTVQRLDRDTLAGVGTPVRIDGGLAGAVIDGDGVIWVATREAGTILRFGQDGRASTVPVAASGTPITITLVGGRPVAVDIRAGVVVPIDPSSLSRGEPARLAQPPTGRLEVSTPDAPAPYLWLLDTGANSLFRVDLRSRKVEGPVPLDSGRPRWGQPVVHAGRVYAPNKANYRLVVTDVSSLRRLDDIDVPGAGAGFDLTLQGGALWANDPSGGVAVVVDTEGKAKKVGKGKGEGRTPEKSDQPPQAPDPKPGGNPSPPPPPPPRGRPPTTAPPPGPPITAPPADVTVPNLTGLTRPEACAALTNVTLTCQPSETDGGKIGRVATQDPAAGITLRPKAPVKVGIGLGVQVPRLQGAPRDSACAELRSLKLQCVAQAVPLDQGKTRNEVFEQQPADGARVDEGAGVTVRFYGDARNLPVPDLTRDTLATACPKVTAAGFFSCEVTRVKARPAPRPAPTSVVGQDPAGGTQVTADTPVTVQVYDPDPVPVPAPSATDDHTTYCATLQAQLFTCAAATTATVGPFVGAIAATAPAAGTNGYPGDRVTVTSHTRTTVPDLVTATPANACATLAGLRLACPLDNRGAAPDAATPVGPVVAQSIAPGQASDASTAVTVAFYSSPWVEPSVPMYLIRYNNTRELYTVSPTCGQPGWTCVGQIGWWWPGPGAGRAAVNQCFDAETGITLNTVDDVCTNRANPNYDPSFETVRPAPIGYVHRGPAVRGQVQRLCRDDIGPRRYRWSNSGVISGWKDCNEVWNNP